MSTMSALTLIVLSVAGGVLLGFVIGILFLNAYDRWAERRNKDER